MTRVAGNGLTLSELEQIEESALHSQTSEAKTVLRLAAALREALQAKENACALVAELKGDRDIETSAASLDFTRHFQKPRAWACQR